MSKEEIQKVKEELEALGFTLKEEYCDSEIKYDTYELTPKVFNGLGGQIEVTINHTDSTMWYSIMMDDEELPFKSPKDIFRLIRILYKGRKLKNEMFKPATA